MKTFYQRDSFVMMLQTQVYGWEFQRKQMGRAEYDIRGRELESMIVKVVLFLWDEFKFDMIHEFKNLVAQSVPDRCDEFGI